MKRIFRFKKLSNVKVKREIEQIFVAFSEYFNFSFSSKVVVYIVEMRSHHDLGLLTCALKQKKDLPSL